MKATATFAVREIYPIDKDGNRIGENLRSNALDVQLLTDFQQNLVTLIATLAMVAPFEFRTNHMYLSAKFVTLAREYAP